MEIKKSKAEWKKGILIIIAVILILIGLFFLLTDTLYSPVGGTHLSLLGLIICITPIILGILLLYLVKVNKLRLAFNIMGGILIVLVVLVLWIITQEHQEQKELIPKEQAIEDAKADAKVFLNLYPNAMVVHDIFSWCCEIRYMPFHRVAFCYKPYDNENKNEDWCWQELLDAQVEIYGHGTETSHKKIPIYPVIDGLPSYDPYISEHIYCEKDTDCVGPERCTSDCIDLTTACDCTNFIYKPTYPNREDVKNISFGCEIFSDDECKCINNKCVKIKNNENESK